MDSKTVNGWKLISCDGRLERWSKKSGVLTLNAVRYSDSSSVTRVSVTFDPQDILPGSSMGVIELSYEFYEEGNGNINDLFAKADDLFKRTVGLSQ